jgi:hypothetical protein
MDHRGEHDRGHSLGTPRFIGIRLFRYSSCCCPVLSTIFECTDDNVGPSLDNLFAAPHPTDERGMECMQSTQVDCSRCRIAAVEFSRPMVHEQSVCPSLTPLMVLRGEPSVGCSDPRSDTTRDS